LGLSQDELGAKLGLKKGALGKHEREECFPTRKMLKTLAFDYNVSMDYLLCNRGTLFYEKEKVEKNETEFKMDVEENELFSLMRRLPLVRHSVMSYFHRFKIDNRDILEKESV